MDIALVIALAQAVQPVAVPAAGVDVIGQAYVVLNTTALIAAAFWMGVQWNTIRTSQREIAEMKKKVDMPVAPIAEMKVLLDAQAREIAEIKGDIEQLSDSMDRFQRSVFMDAMRVGRRDRPNDATT